MPGNTQTLKQLRDFYAAHSHPVTGVRAGPDTVPTQPPPAEFGGIGASIGGGGGAGGGEGGAGAGGSPVAYDFAFGDASPAVLTLATGVVVSVSIVIEAPFNGMGAQLSIAAGSTPLMLAGDNLPGEAGRYETNPGARLMVPTPISLTINPGAGASAGSGIVYLEIAQ